MQLQNIPFAIAKISDLLLRSVERLFCLKKDKNDYGIFFRQLQRDKKIMIPSIDPKDFQEETKKNSISCSCV